MRSSRLLDEFMIIVLSVISILLFVLTAFTLMVHTAHARSSPEFSGAISHWYASLMQPDNPTVSCCGDADAYWADEFEVDAGGEYVAIITDDRGQEYDERVGRIPRAVGTKIPVPNRKLTVTQGNPTGHGVIFVSTSGFSICYVTPAGG